MALFEGCFDGAAVARRVTEDTAQGAKLGIRSTPTFLIGRVGADGDVRVSAVISGAQPVQEFRTVIDAALR